MVKKYIGGVKPMKEGVPSFESVMAFLQKSIVSSVSYSSRFGFIFKAELKSGLESEFLELNDSKTLFDKPVTTLVFKIAILIQEENYDRIKDKAGQLPDYIDSSGKHREKSVESYDNFMMEAKIQNEVYEKTVSRGQPLCPALIDVSSISEIREASSFLDLMNCADDAEAKNMKTYMLTALRGTQYPSELGIITMSSALDYSPFSLLPDKTSLQLYSSVVYSVIRLLNETQRVHGDLNKGNIMVKQLSDGRYISLLVDFNSVFLVDSMTEKQKQLSNSLQPFFMDKNGSLVMNQEVITLNKSQFSEQDVQTFITFISAVDKAYHVTTRDMEEEQHSLFEKNFLAGFTSYDSVANMLNEYYILPNKVIYKNTMVDFDKNMDKTSMVGSFLQLEAEEGSPFKENRRNANAAPSIERYKKRSESQISKSLFGDSPPPKQTNTNLFGDNDEDSPRKIKSNSLFGDDESPPKKSRGPDPEPPDYNLLPKGGRKFTKKRRVRRKTMKRSKKPKKKATRKSRR